MAVPGIPQNFNVQTANQVVLCSWNLTATATSYKLYRSLDNITFTLLATLSGSPLATSYQDSTVTLGTMYWYRVLAANSDGDGSPTTSQSIVPSRAGEMSLGAIRLAAQQTADKVNSNFVTMPEWNSFINLAMFELYDLLITTYEDLYVATPIQFTANGQDFLYPLPNGSLDFASGLNPNTTLTKAKPFYKLLGVDLGLSTANNAFVTVNKFNFADRNRFVYPNTASTIYGVFNLQYRLLGLNQIEFIPTPSGGQTIRIWYIPRLTELLADTDLTDIGISGWLRYVIVRAAKYALDKEESDTSKLDAELLFLQERIQTTASNRDAGSPDKISQTSYGSFGNGWSGGWNGPLGGF